MTACCLYSPSHTACKGQVWSHDSTANPPWEQGNNLTCPWWRWSGVGRGCTGQHRCASPCHCCSHLCRQSGGETLHQPGQQQQSTCTQCFLAQHSSPPSSTSSSPSPKNPSSTAWPYQQSSSLTAYEDREMPNTQSALLQRRRQVSLHMSRVCARSGRETPSQEGESTSEQAMKNCVHTTALRLTFMGSSSTMLIIPSPLDAKWKPSDRRTLATET